VPRDLNELAYHGSARPIERVSQQVLHNGAGSIQARLLRLNHPIANQPWVFQESLNSLLKYSRRDGGWDGR
jgi:hypothetical protein